MFSGLPEQKVNGNSAQALGPRETLFLWLAEEKVTGNSAQAAGPRETNVSTASFGACAQKASFTEVRQAQHSQEVGGSWASLTSCFTHDMALVSQVHNLREHAGMESKRQIE